MLFTGAFEPSIDAKGRVAIPAEIRADLDPEVDGEAFFLMLAPNRTLRLYPEKTFHRLVRQFGERLVNNKRVQEFVQAVFPETRKVTIDSAGRIRLPDSVLERAGLKDHDIVLLGMRDHMEIRGRDEWRAQQDERLSGLSDIFDQFAEFDQMSMLNPENDATQHGPQNRQNGSHQ